MSRRRLYLDRGIGEARGVVTLEGRPERLLIERDGNLRAQALGARSVARVTRVVHAQALAFLALAEGPDAVVNLGPETAWLSEGLAVEAEIRSEGRAGKGASARLIGPAEGPPRLIEAGPTIEDRLQAFAPQAEIVCGAVARSMADAAQEEALETVFPLAGGGSLAVERTRALTAVDVDLGERPGAEAKRAARTANLAAVALAARVLRLKGLGGLVVIDLIGRGRDGPALLAATRAAFAPDNPGVALGAVSRFGTLELTVPRRSRPVVDILGHGSEEGADLTAALALVRGVEREAARDGGARLEAVASPEVVALAAPLLARLGERIGARASLRAEAGRARSRFEVVAG